MDRSYDAARINDYKFGTDFRNMLNSMYNVHKVDTHPNIQQNYDVYICGFPSKKKLESWFGEYLDMLIHLEFKITTYKVKQSEMLHGKSKKQLMFIKP